MKMYNCPKGDGNMSAQKRQNISVDPVIFEKFCNIAGPKGIKISTWITAKMREFVEEEEALEEQKEKLSLRHRHE